MSQAPSSCQLLFNPGCSKCRGALQLLKDNGQTPQVVKYLEDTPSKEALWTILHELNLRPRELMRTGEAVYKEKGLDDPALTDSQLVRAMLENPILIERPILRLNGKAVIGRPPEKVLELF